MAGYKIAQHRSLAEMVRRVPETIDELRSCWGFGGSGVRVEKYGDMFLSALQPHVAQLHAAHAAASAQYTSEVMDSETSEVAVAQAGAAAARRLKALRDREALEEMPRSMADLLPAEVPVYEALIAATHVRAEEIGESYVWNIAQVRSLVEMVRRCPTTMDELRLCWG